MLNKHLVFTKCLISGAKYFSILAQYKIPLLIQKIDHNKLWGGSIPVSDAEKISDLISLLLTDGPATGLFPGENTFQLLKLVVTSLKSDPEVLNKYTENGVLKMFEGFIGNKVMTE